MTAEQAGSETICRECGAAVTGGRVGCQGQFDKILARVFGAVALTQIRVGRDLYRSVHLFERRHPSAHFLSCTQ